MAGTSTDSNAAEQSSKKHVKQLLSKLPRLTTKRKKTDETTALVSRPVSQPHNSTTSVKQVVASSGNMLAKVISNDTGYLADADISPRYDAATIHASPVPISAASDVSTAFWSAKVSSGNNTAITTPGSSPNGKGKQPIRAGVLPDASPRSGSNTSWPKDGCPSATRSITWSNQVKIPSQDSGDKAASSETNFIDSDALTRVVTSDKGTHVGSSARSSSGAHYERPGIRKSVTPWSEDPNWKISEKAQAYQKAVLSADPDTLPVVAKAKSAPENSSSRLPVSKKKRVSSSGKQFKGNKKKEALEMSKAGKAQQEFGKLKRATTLPQETEPVPELEPMKDPGYDKWVEMGKDQKTKQRRELVSGISSYNWSTAQRHRTQPIAERTPIGPSGEVAYTDNQPSSTLNTNFAKHNGKLADLDVAYLTASLPTDGVSPRMVPPTLSAAVKTSAFESEEEPSAISTSSSASSASDSGSSTEPDSDSSAHNNSTSATRARKASKSTASTTPTDSTRPSQYQHYIPKTSVPHPRSGSIDLDLLESKLVKAGRYEIILSSSMRSSATPPNACPCWDGGRSKVEMYRSETPNQERNGRPGNGFRSCEMKKKNKSEG